jgi:hypothetical protein
LLISIEDEGLELALISVAQIRHARAAKYKISLLKQLLFDVTNKKSFSDNNFINIQN